MCYPSVRSMRLLWAMLLAGCASHPVDPNLLGHWRDERFFGDSTHELWLFEDRTYVVRLATLSGIDLEMGTYRFTAEGCFEMSPAPGSYPPLPQPYVDPKGRRWVYRYREVWSDDGTYDVRACLAGTELVVSLREPNGEWWEGNRYVVQHDEVAPIVRVHRQR